MSEMLIVLRREFLERVRSKGFLLGTLLFPLFIIGIYTIPLVAGGEKGTTRLTIVDEGPPGIAQSIARSLADTTGREGRSYAVEVIRRPLEAVRADLTARVGEKELDGYIHVPPDAVTASRMDYRARNVANFQVMGDVQRAASEAVRGERLRAAGLQGAQVAALLQPVEVNTARITAQGEEGGNAFSTFMVAYGVAMLIYMMIFLYAVNVMRSVLEEKQNRIAEVIVSSMRAPQLMMGKIIGVGSVALLQVAIWVTIVSTAMWQIRRLAGENGGGMEQALAALKLKPGAAAALLGFFVLGFFLYAAVFAAVGAAVNSEQEAQQFQFVAMVPLILPVLFLTKVTGDPLGQTATVLGMIPFTAPVANAMRLGTAEIPAAQVAGSLLLLAVTTVAVAWIAGKIYRVGILSTGKKPSIGELVRWLKAA